MTKALSLAFALVLAPALVTVGSAVAQAPAPKLDVAALEVSGNKHYELAEYDAAIADFKEAFRISDEPAFLFNIAQSYRLQKDCREAATFYKTFLRRVPTAPNASKIKARIKEMDACAKTQPPPVVTPPPVEPAPVVPPVVTPPPPVVVTSPTPAPAPIARENPRAWMKWGGIASLGVGVLGLGLGVKFALDAKAADDDINACSTAMTCTSEEARGFEDDGKAANRNTIIATVAGGAFVATGVMFLVLWRGGAQESPPPASVSLTPGGATATFAWQF